MSRSASGTASPFMSNGVDTPPPPPPVPSSTPVNGQQHAHTHIPLPLGYHQPPHAPPSPMHLAPPYYHAHYVHSHSPLGHSVRFSPSPQSFSCSCDVSPVRFSTRLTIACIYTWCGHSTVSACCCTRSRADRLGGRCSAWCAQESFHDYIEK